eukprot:GFUD01119213.1.p1 GENE.GFUD01119213.1~~GFUD01119213.1.p1  ORF type:complete len:832 (+),score=108.53 GFUD01119213.1:2-2497(+)
MRRLLTLGVILFSSFSIGSLPPGSPNECCKQMTVGDQLYHYVGWDVNAQSQYNCYSNCVYSTDCNPGKRVCFKKEFVTGGKSQEKSVCNDVEGPKTTGQQCDRPCFSYSPSLICVFNFTLEMLKSDTPGRRADGRIRSVLAYNGQIPGPPIVICEGDELVVNFKNDITGNMTNMDGSSDVTTLHFHGVREKTRPWSDGVPFVSQCPITPECQKHKNNHNPFPFPYGFNTDVDGAPAGTYWYHSHVGAQRTNGAYGALIIKEKGTNAIIDDASNTLVLQEWYESSTNQVPVSLLINGNGRIGALMNTGDDEQITAHLTGKGTCFCLTKNKHFDPVNFTTKYTEFHVKQPGYQYRFRIIGAISQNLPLRLSIENHTFTAIAMDSLNIQPVTDLTDLWLAAGERYDILVKTTEEQDQPCLAYKIKVIGFTDQPDNKCPLCTIAWLKYPNQYIDHTYVTDSACTGFHLPPPLRTLNPVPNKYAAWKNRIKYPNWKNPSTTGDIFIADLREPKSKSKSTITNLANTQYIEFDGNITFNGLRMSYPRVPFLLQYPANKADRCGSECKGHPPKTKCTTKNPANCSATDYRPCQHVVKEPLAPDWWVEIVLVNNNEGAAAHPIHQHGGWYWVVGEGQYGHNINSKFIRHQDKIHNITRNFINPPAKDTIQVPPRGYVIIRTKLDNAGTWIFHCHINYHVTIGMAMVLQIGEPKDWYTGPLHRNINVPCKTPPPPPGGGPTTINWFYGMENAERCVAPGTTVTFSWVKKGHNVNILTEANYEKCNVSNNAASSGNYPWTAPKVPDVKVLETYYFACGMYSGGHCKAGMRAKIHVRTHCPL